MRLYQARYPRTEASFVASMSPSSRHRGWVANRIWRADMVRGARAVLHHRLLLILELVPLLGERNKIPARVNQGGATEVSTVPWS
jgi:hypothetical protein